MKLAVLMSCFNRRDMTLSCISSLSTQELPDGWELVFYVVDDASSDGTADEIRRLFPEVQLISGDGNLYWNRAMSLAFTKAVECGYDFYLWMNDDTLLEPDAITRLYRSWSRCKERSDAPCIIVGSTTDLSRQRITYGGVKRTGRMHPLKCELIRPEETEVAADAMNGNCVLLDKQVVSRIGVHDPVYQQTMGDYDYALRAIKAGCHVWVAPGYVGICEDRSKETPRRKQGQSIWQYWKEITGPKGLPYKQYAHFMRSHGGILWPVYWLMPYVRHALVGLLMQKKEVSHVQSRGVSAAEKRPHCAFVTNFCPHYRKKTFTDLAEVISVKFFFTSDGSEPYWLPEHGVSTGPFAHQYLSEMNSARRVFSLFKHLWNERYDVIIKCTDGKVYLICSYLVARMRGIPFILWTGIWNQIDTPLHRLIYPLTRYLYRNSDGVIAYGQHVKDFLVSQGVRDSRIYVTRHAVDNERYNRPVNGQEIDEVLEANAIDASKKIFLFVGRLEECKGIPVLLESFSRMDHADSILVLIGVGAEEDNLRSLARQLSVSERVHFVGYVPTDHLHVWYAASYALVLPSITTKRFKETWGLVINEAMNQGLPVIVTDAVGAAAGGLVQHYKNGIIVPERDVSSLTKAMNEVGGNKLLRDRLAKEARESIQRWGNPEMVQDFKHAIESTYAQYRQYHCSERKDE